MKLKKEAVKQEKPVRRKKIYYFIMLLIPLLFFAMLELALRIGGYGHNYETFISSADYNPRMLYLNPEIAFKYFDNLGASNILPDGFYKEKKEGTFRIFVLGESSAAGFPYNSNCSFPSHLKRKLELLYPGRPFEVVNLGASAINSYTMADIFPDVLKQKPDLILIYAGHNEYYGAQGVASSGRVSGSPWLVKLMLGLRNFKTVELFRSIVSSIKGSLASEKNEGTNPVLIDGFKIRTSSLMEEMVSDAYIPFQSETYNDGIVQFEENLSYILEKARDANVPVIIGTLASNLRDQKPFASDNPEQFNKAVAKYNKAIELLNKNDRSGALKMFVEAKEYDGVRFRAPEAINKTIKQLAGKFSLPLADIDSLFKALSPYGITGSNLICDHLHPNFYGYRLIADEYLKVIIKNNYLKTAGPPPDLAFSDSIYNDKFRFTDYDSVYSETVIKVLTGSYPYVEKGTPNKLLSTIRINNFLDSAVMLYRSGARPAIAAWHLEQNNIRKFIDEMYYLIGHAPFDEKPYNTTIEILKAAGIYNSALPYIYEALSKTPANESVNQWKEETEKIINTHGTNKNESRENNNIEVANTHYLAAKAKISQNDPEGALAELDKAIDLNKELYSAYNDKALIIIQLKNDYGLALQLFNKALEIKPDFEESLLNRAYLYYIRRMLKEAMLDVNSAISRNQSNGRLYYTRGLIYFEVGKKKQACEDWKKALELGFDPAARELAEKCR